jgi:hypothetical protein
MVRLLSGSRILALLDSPADIACVAARCKAARRRRR